MATAANNIQLLLYIKVYDIVILFNQQVTSTSKEHIITRRSRYLLSDLIL